MSIEIWRPRSVSMSPWRAFDEMERAVDEAFGMRPMARRRLPEEREWMPSVEMFERDNKYVVKAELPGVKKEDIDISVADHNLTIKGEKKATRETKKEDYYMSEVSYGSFMRSLPLPENVDTENVEANFSDGLLEVTVPKMAVAKPRRISISGKKEGSAKMTTEAEGEETEERERKKSEERGSPKR